MLKGIIRILERQSTRHVLARLVKLLEQNPSHKIAFSLSTFLVGSAVGTYSGIYATQNYNVPIVSSPLNMKDKFNEYLEAFRKEPPIESPTKLDDK